MLLRMDIGSNSSGALVATLSDQAAGFAPYRVDNCTAQILHLRFGLPGRAHDSASREGFHTCCCPLNMTCACSQQSYQNQEDILRPYSSLLYAWDEPTLPNKLVVALPGNRWLGAFDLDRVGLLAPGAWALK